MLHSCLLPPLSPPHLESNESLMKDKMRFLNQFNCYFNKPSASTSVQFRPNNFKFSPTAWTQVDQSLVSRLVKYKLPS